MQRRRGITIALAVAAAAALTAALLLFNTGRLVKYELERRLGEDFSVGRISLGLRGVEAYGVALKKNGKVFLQAERLAVRADILGFLKKHYSISEIVLDKPVLRLETDRGGRLINNPFSPSAPQSRSSLPAFEVKRFLVKEGTLLYYDGKISHPAHLTRLESVELDLKRISVPLNGRWSDYKLAARIPGKKSTGTLSWTGKTDFRSLDTDAKLILDGLDITGFKPYYMKKGDADVSRGGLSITMGVKVRSKHLHAPGTAVVKNLEFNAGKGLGGGFMGAPRALVLNMLKTGNDEIALDFVIEGKLDDPKFSIRENFMKRFTVGLARNLGLTVLDAGKSVVELGAKGVKGIGSGIQKLFGK
ncbi:MAG TPA: DUF748 domain-containing protein [Dissulfurispiraceae bacterium]